MNEQQRQEAMREMYFEANHRLAEVAKIIPLLDMAYVQTLQGGLGYLTRLVVTRQAELASRN